MLTRFREWRLRNVKAELRNWREEAHYATSARRELECERVIRRLEKKVARLRKKLQQEGEHRG